MQQDAVLDPDTLSLWILGTGMLVKSYQNGVSRKTRCFAQDILLLFSFAQS